MAGSAHPIRYAGFWKRATAYGYDVIVLQVASVLLMLAFSTFPTMEQFVRMDPAVDRWFGHFSNLYLVLAAAYNILLVAGPNQATLGKRYCGIYVARADGGRLGLAQSASRHLLSGVSALIAGFGFLTVAFTREKTALHDIIAKTRVLYREPV